MGKFVQVGDLFRSELEPEKLLATLQYAEAPIAETILLELILEDLEWVCGVPAVASSMGAFELVSPNGLSDTAQSRLCPGDRPPCALVT
jgi:hypothetical protein